MERINVYKIDGYEEEFIGWFDTDKAKKLASLTVGDPYKTYTDIYLTKSGKLILSESNNSGGNTVYSTCSTKYAIECCIKSPCQDGAEWLIDVKNTEVNKWEI